MNITTILHLTELSINPSSFFTSIWPETTINYTMIYYIATMAIALWSMSLGY